MAIIYLFIFTSSDSNFIMNRLCVTKTMRKFTRVSYNTHVWKLLVPLPKLPFKNLRVENVIFFGVMSLLRQTNDVKQSTFLVLLQTTVRSRFILNYKNVFKSESVCIAEGNLTTKLFMFLIFFFFNLLKRFASDKTY